MAITLEEAKKNVQDDLQMGVIDEFQKSNWILEHIPFDDAVSPTGGGATPTYSYTRLKTQPTAEFREINKENTPSEVTKETYRRYQSIRWFLRDRPCDRQYGRYCE